MIKNLHFITLFILMLSCLCITANAQVLVKGTVVDDKNESLIGVSVRLKDDSSVGTITDFDGKFTISVPKKNDILLITYVGYASQEVKATPEKPLFITLQEDSKFLEEVVVIGYQTVRRRDLTGSVGKANIDDMLKAPTSSFTEALGGRVAGVQVSSSEGTPGSTMNIVIRGNNSVTQDNSPLYVIDGFPVEDAEAAASINPKDIESLDVLKDASATAIYGARGANGVVMITTKRGKVGAPQVSYDFSAGVQRISNKMKLMDAYEFVRLQSEVYDQASLNGNYGYFQTYNGKKYGLEDYRNAQQYDWQDMIFRSAWLQSHNVTLTGGTEGIRYNASVSYYDQDGIIIRSSYNKMQGKMGLNIVKDKIRSNFNVNYNRSVQQGASPSQSSYSGMNNLFFSVWGYRPVTQPNRQLSSLLDNLVDEDIDTTNDYRFNPILSLNNEHKKNIITYLQFNGYIEYSFTKKLKLKVSGGYVTDNRRNETFNNSNTRYGYSGSTEGVNATLVTSEKRNWLNENTLTYNTRIKKHSINLLGGITLQDIKYLYNSISAKQIPYESLGMSGMKYGTSYGQKSLSSESSLLSYLGRVTYNYDSKYYATVSMRADGSSKFDKDNRWGYFPSVALAWTLSEEKFFKPLKEVVNSVKVRAGWGQIGNNRIDDYQRFALLTQAETATGNYTLPSSNSNSVYPIGGNENSVGVIPTQISNKGLKWETTEQSNVGVDISLFAERVNITIDWYNKETKDLLYAAALPTSSGFAQAMRNIGKVRNRGLEISFSTTNIKTKDFTWTSDFNIAFNRNKVMALSESDVAMTTIAAFDQDYNSTPSYIAKVGYPMGMMYGLLYEGTYKVDDFVYESGSYTLKPGVAYVASVDRAKVQPGHAKYRDLNNDGVINSDDYTMIGRGEPSHIGGFTNNFTYKDFDLSIFFQWSYGNDILNANRLMFESGYKKKKDLNQFASYANRWSFDNQNSNIPIVNDTGTNELISSRVIEDGSFLRLKTLSLGYTIPSHLLKKYFVKSLRLNVSAQNLFTITDYSGYDPEVSIRNTAITPGLDFSAYPRARTFSFGLNATF